MKPSSYQQQTRDLIDGLKAVCASNGLGNDGNNARSSSRPSCTSCWRDKFAHR
ncbi:MAG: hypothetical protein U1F20_04685 [Lysobacterales bacterium]